MRKLILIPVLLTQLSFAADTESINAVKFLNEVISNPQKGVIDTSCVACAATSELPKDLFCEDLFEAACFDKDGSHSKKGADRTQSIKLLKTIKEARDETAKALGYKNTSVYLQEKLLDKGLIISSEPEPGHWDSLIEEDVDEDPANVNQLRFTASDSCLDEKKEIDELPETERLEKFKAFNKKYNEEKLNVYALNIPDFMKTEIKDKCGELKWIKYKYEKADNKKIEDVCKQFSVIKKEAVNLYVKEGTDGYYDLALAFVKKYQMPETSYNTEPADENKLEFHADEAAGVCGKLSKSIHGVARKIVEEELKQFAKAKPTVEYLINNIYSSDRKKKSHELLSTAVESIQKFLPVITQDKEKVSKIKNGYKKIRMDWMEKPGDTKYEKGKNFNLPVLKQLKDSDEDYFAFMDYHLEKFKTFNAYYDPDHKTELNKGVEKIFMLPAFIITLDESPYQFLSIIAHEAGHKLGPRVSRFNTHDLGAEWKELMQCYEKKDSIRMNEDQADETIADYISSTVLSDVLGRLPASERRNALKEALQDFCTFDDENNHKYTFNCEKSHPENSLRISGIYGANPRLRETVGCSQPSSKFQSCGLKRAKNK